MYLLASFYIVKEKNFLPDSENESLGKSRHPATQKNVTSCYTEKRDILLHGKTRHPATRKKCAPHNGAGCHIGASTGLSINPYLQLLLSCDTVATWNHILPSYTASFVNSIPSFLNVFISTADSIADVCSWHPASFGSCCRASFAFGSDTAHIERAMRTSSV